MDKTQVEACMSVCGLMYACTCWCCPHVSLLFQLPLFPLHESEIIITFTLHCANISHFVLRLRDLINAWMASHHMPVFVCVLSLWWIWGWIIQSHSERRATCITVNLFIYLTHGPYALHRMQVLWSRAHVKHVHMNIQMEGTEGKLSHSVTCVLESFSHVPLHFSISPWALLLRPQCYDLCALEGTTFKVIFHTQIRKTIPLLCREKGWVIYL